MRLAAAILLLAVAFPAALAAEPESATDADLIRMESAKWEPAALANPLGLLSMFSPDMLSVDYGGDLHGGAERRTWKEILAYGPLPAWKMRLGDWKVLHVAPDVIVLSYKVTGVSVDWKAFATSVWTRRDGAWRTVFYQATRAK
ncbi:MAG TPA: nuclear transport factor 2 family protein [Usitatibacter sp.]|nr:nuclear transport factor 2 family protein [Usitatibacter sp.]